MTSDHDRYGTEGVILRLIVTAERMDDWGAYSLEGVGKTPILVCSSLLERIAAPATEVRAAVARLRTAALVEPEAIRIQPHAAGRLGLPVPDDLDADGEDIRSIIVRFLQDAPQREATIAAALGGRSGHLQRVLNRLYITGVLAPPSSLWSTAAGRALVP